MASSSGSDHGIDVFAGIPDQELRLAGRRRTFQRDEVVFHRDDPGDGVHRVERGHFAARILTAHGDVATIALYGPSDTFGLLAVVGAEPRRTATVVALDASETLAVSTTSFGELRRRYPAITEATEHLLAAQLARTSELLTQALYWPAIQRVQARLGDLAELYRVGDGGEIVVPLSQEHLAGLAGTTRETVNRVLREEAETGSIALSRNRIVIHDPQRFIDRAQTRLG